MARVCTICSHDQRKAIEAAHKKLLPNRRIASQYGVAESSLRRHFAAHVEQVAQLLPHADRPRVSGKNIPDEIKPEIQDAFLEKFIELANESGACRLVNVSRSTVRYWEEHDATFGIRYQDAKEQVNDAIRAEIHRRAVTGYEDSLVSAKGELFTVTKYSDRLLEFLAKARMPEYREKTQIEVQSTSTVTHRLSALSDQELALLEQLAIKTHGNT